jgi:hypothetical protein
VEVPAGSTMTLRVNFDYAGTSIADFTIIGCYSLLATSQAGQYCWPIPYEQTAFAFKKLIYTYIDTKLAKKAFVR